MDDLLSISKIPILTLIPLFSIPLYMLYLSFSCRSTLLGFLSTIRSAIWNLAVGLTRLTSSTLNSYIPKLNCLSIELMGCVNTMESIVVHAITKFRKTKHISNWTFIPRNGTCWVFQPQEMKRTTPVVLKHFLMSPLLWRSDGGPSIISQISSCHVFL